MTTSSSLGLIDHTGLEIVADGTYRHAAKEFIHMDMVAQPGVLLHIRAGIHTSLDIFWIKDKSPADLDNLPDPAVLAADIMENLQSVMDSFQELMKTLQK